MWKVIILTGVLLGTVGFSGYAQGKGGGIWLEDGASCIGTLIYKNQATDGFGVAGQNGILLNCTVTQNSSHAVDVYYPKPGDIYCSNGDIVDREAYRNRTQKDAVGIVFWLNGDPDVTYPKGAVVSLDGQIRCKWGLEDVSYWLLLPYVDEGSGFPKQDTGCYRNTWQLEKWWQENGGYYFEAGHHCWNYKAYFQTNHPHEATKNIRWCMPTLKFLSAIMIELPEIIRSLEVVKETHPIQVDDFVYLLADQELAYYWSADDAISEFLASFAWVVNFYNGHCTDDKNVSYTRKEYENLVRPIFLY